MLKYIAAARDAGLGVVFITHNPHHAYLVGDHFIILKLGQAVLDKKRSEVSLDELTRRWPAATSWPSCPTSCSGEVSAAGDCRRRRTPARGRARSPPGTGRGREQESACPPKLRHDKTSSRR